MSEQPTQQQAQGGKETLEVHNAWTIYGLNDDGSEAEQPLAELCRPQDWGHPRWNYHRFQFAWESAPDGRRYVNHCHCWTDLTRETGGYAELFASLIVQILMPGSPAELCGREYLDEDDFWSEEWGKTPPFIEAENEEGGIW